MDDFLIILAILALIAITVFASGKWKLLIKKPEIKAEKESQILSSKEALEVAAARKAAYSKNGKSEDDEDKILCEFCDSYVEIPENGICPNCGGSLKEAIEKLNEQKALVQLEMMKIEDEMEKERAQRERVDKLIDLATAASVSMFAPVAGGAMLKSAAKKHKKK